MLEPPVTDVCQTLQLLCVTMFEVDQVNQQETFLHFKQARQWCFLEVEKRAF